MQHPELWPPLSVVRQALQGTPPADDPPGVGTVAIPGAAVCSARGAAPPSAVPDLLLPLTELARRREAVARRGFTARWVPGRLVSVVHEGRLLGVLLDRLLPDGRWQGFVAAGEPDWAGAFDVLLEPDDEPFEPLFGVVQAWNVIAVAPSAQLCARVLGEVCATRLAAIRAVHDEWTAEAPPPIAPEPGRIALRSVGGVFSVLSGTPLGTQDPRSDYQALYRDAALKLTCAEAPSAAPRAQAPPPPARGGWGSIRRWFGGDGWMRPAFAVLALCVIVQNVGVFGGRDHSEDDDVRFRNVPTAPAAQPNDLFVRWKDGVQLEEADRLLQSMSADVVSGPGGNGVWRLRVSDPVKGLSQLAASPLVQSSGPISERP